MNVKLDVRAIDGFLWIEVEVYYNVVTLTEEVEFFKEKELCGDIVKSVKGVIGLNNEIIIDYQTSRIDSEIANEVEAALEWNAMIDAGVNNRHVELSVVVGSAAQLPSMTRMYILSKINRKWTMAG